MAAGIGRAVGAVSQFMDSPVTLGSRTIDTPGGVGRWTETTTKGDILGYVGNRLMDFGGAVAGQPGVGRSGNTTSPKSLSEGPFQPGAAVSLPQRELPTTSSWTHQLALGAGPSGAGVLASPGSPPALPPGSAGQLAPPPPPMELGGPSPAPAVLPPAAVYNSAGRSLGGGGRAGRRLGG